MGIGKGQFGSQWRVNGVKAVHDSSGERMRCQLDSSQWLDV